MVSSKSSAMPDRSSTIPMNVKKGMASNVSFDKTPQSRDGSVTSSGQSSVIVPFDSGASSTPMMKNKSPLAASEKATG